MFFTHPTFAADFSFKLTPELIFPVSEKKQSHMIRLMEA